MRLSKIKELAQAYPSGEDCNYPQVSDSHEDSQLEILESNESVRRVPSQ